MSDLRDELIQVAAVAAAIVEDIDNGTTSSIPDSLSLMGVWPGVDSCLVEIRAERVRQERKWGPQHHSIMEWLAIWAKRLVKRAERRWSRTSGPNVSKGCLMTPRERREWLAQQIHDIRHERPKDDARCEDLADAVLESGAVWLEDADLEAMERYDAEWIELMDPDDFYRSVLVVGFQEDTE